MNDTDRGNGTVRNLLRVSGLILWVLVLFVLYGAWQSSDKRAEGFSNSPQTPLAKTSKKTKKPQEAKQKSKADEKGIEDFELIERSGKKITKADLLGRPWVACFVFSRCAGPCPLIMGQMRILHDELEDRDVRFVTITVDPDHDTPEQLKRYADAFNADPKRWLFLTGDKKQIYGLIAGSFKLPVGEQRGEIFHTNRVVHVDAQGRVVGSYLFPKESERIKLKRVLRKTSSVKKRPSKVESSGGGGRALSGKAATTEDR